MRAVVTGARGFVGPYLTAHLRSEGDDVVEMDLAGPVAVDVTDADSVLGAITDAGPEVVYHLAALSHVGASWSSPGLSFRVNAEKLESQLTTQDEVASGLGFGLWGFEFRPAFAASRGARAAAVTPW